MENSRPDEMKTVGNVQFYRRKKFSYLTVFAGTFNGEKVAVKRVQLLDPFVDRELTNNRRLHHPNIVQFKHFEEDNDFR